MKKKISLTRCVI